MPSNKYSRDFYDYGALKRPGRIDRDLFQGYADVGDGYGGTQWIFRHILGDLIIPKFVIDGCLYNGVDTLSNGYIMYDGEVVQVEQQAIVVANGEFLFIDVQGNAHTTGVQATAQAHVIIYERDVLAVGYDIRFRVIDNILSALGFQGQWLTIEHDAVIGGDVTVDGDADITGDVDIDGDVDIAGTTDMHDVLDMDGNLINDVADPLAAQDAVTRTYLRNFMPVGTILMFNGVGWVDNVSMVGWYTCNLANVAHGVPNLTNRFIRSMAASGNVGGADTVALAANEIPTHVSDGTSANHTHTGTSGGQSVTHNHAITINNDMHNHGSWTGYYNTSHTHTFAIGGYHVSYCLTPRGTCTGSIGNGTTAAGGSNHRHSIANDTHNHVASSGNNSVDHTHTTTTGNESADHTHTYTNGALAAHQNMPSYYSLIFVMRTV